MVKLNKVSLFDNNEISKWVPLLVPDSYGYLQTSKGAFLLDLQTIYNNWVRVKNDIVIDYEHQSEPKGDGVVGVAPAAGWIKELDISDGVLFGRVEWTAKAQAHIAEKEYKYLSPTLLLDDKKKTTTLISVGLTNRPATYSATPLTLSNVNIVLNDGIKQEKNKTSENGEEYEKRVRYTS